MCDLDICLNQLYLHCFSNLISYYFFSMTLIKLTLWLLEKFTEKKKNSDSGESFKTVALTQTLRFSLQSGRDDMTQASFCP